MQARVREHYRRLAVEEDWLVLDGERPPDVIAAGVLSALTPLVRG